MTNDELEKMVNEHASKLAEFVDSVRIFVTIPTDNDSQITQAYSTGRGNFYAQHGQIAEWLLRQDETSRFQQRKECEENEC